MTLSLDLLTLLTDGVFTTLCGLLIMYFILSKRLVTSVFYYSWVVGFFIYGTEIFLRVYDIPYILVEALVFVAFIFFAIGILYLSRAKTLFYALAGISFLSIIFLVLYFSSMIPFTYLAAFGGSVVYLFIAAAILQHRLIFGITADRLAIGWVLLYFTNIFLANMSWVTNVFAILAKVIILLGIIDYDFIVIAKKAQQRPFPPPDAGYGKEGGFNLIVSSENSNAVPRESNWLRKKVEENVRQGLNSIVFVFQDVFSYKELRAVKWISPDKVSIYLFSSSAQKVRSEFTVLPMGLTQIGAALSQATKQCVSSGNGCDVFFLHLSLLIHLYGAEAVQVMLLNKMGYLRENGITLYAVFYPSMHSDRSTVSLFTKLADEVIKL